MKEGEWEGCVMMRWKRRKDEEEGIREREGSPTETKPPRARNSQSMRLLYGPPRDTRGGGKGDPLKRTTR